MKTLATLAAASALTLAGAALAQTTPPAPPSQPQAQDQTTPRPARPRLTRADLDALTDARMAAIQAGLKLNADQQRLWTPVEQALRVMATARADALRGSPPAPRPAPARRPGPAGAQPTPPTPPDLAQRLEQGAERATQAAQRLAASRRP